MSNEQEKAKLGADTLKGFFTSLGDDVYAHALLEILFEGLMNEEDLFISGKQEQATRNKTNNDSNG